MAEDEFLRIDAPTMRALAWVGMDRLLAAVGSRYADRVLVSPEVAGMLTGCGVKAIRKACDSGDLPSVGATKRWIALSPLERRGLDAEAGLRYALQDARENATPEQRVLEAGADPGAIAMRAGMAELLALTERAQS